MDARISPSGSSDDLEEVTASARNVAGTSRLSLRSVSHSAFSLPIRTSRLYFSNSRQLRDSYIHEAENPLPMGQLNLPAWVSDRDSVSYSRRVRMIPPYSPHTIVDNYYCDCSYCSPRDRPRTSRIPPSYLAPNILNRNGSAMPTLQNRNIGGGWDRSQRGMAAHVGINVAGSAAPPDELSRPPPLHRPAAQEPVCTLCNKLFARIATLKVHMRIHRGEKPYRCSYCNKSFSQSGNLTTHIRIHTGEKPYMCRVCDKRFTQSSALKCHLKLHERELHNYFNIRQRLDI